MLLELAALKYLFTDEIKINSSDNSFEWQPMTIRCILFSLFLVIPLLALIILIFSDYTFLQVIGLLIDGLESITIGAVRGYKEGYKTTELHNDAMVLVAPIVILFIWALLIYVISYVTLFLSSILSIISSKWSGLENIKNVMFTLFIVATISSMIIGYQKYQTQKRIEQMEKRERLKNQSFQSGFIYNFGNPN